MSLTEDRKRPRSRTAETLEWLDSRLHLSELFSIVSHFGFVYTPVDTQRPIRDVLAELETQPVSSYLQWPRVLGLFTTVVFGVVAVTGVLLAFYYQPTPEAAYASTRRIARDVPIGWWVRQVHAWGSWLLLIAVTLRLMRFFQDRLYRAPREILWASMVLIAWIVVQLDFTGRLLPWTQSGYWSVTRGLEVIAGLPIVGPVFTFIGGGRSVNEVVLLRFYVLHTLILPATFMGLFFLTFATLRRIGLSGRLRPGPAATGRDHLYSIVLLFVLVTGVLSTLAVAVPLPFIREADPVATPAGITAPWYLVLPEIIRDRVPFLAWPISLLFVLSTLFVLFLPVFLPRGEEERADRVRPAIIAGALVWVLLTAAGLFLERGR